MGLVIALDSERNTDSPSLFIDTIKRDELSENDVMVDTHAGQRERESR